MKTMIRAAVALLAVASISAQAADEIDNLGGLAQNEFKKLSEDLAAATSYKALTPAEPLGITGFDVGIEVTQTQMANEEVFDIACSGCGEDSITIPKLHAHKGLPMGFDVGFMYASTSSTDLTLMGAELRYANIEGGMATPAVATRLTWSRLDGVSDLDMQTVGIEATVSKGFAMFTPYAGVGHNWVTSEPDVAGLSDEEFTQGKYYVGMNMNFLAINFNFEMDRTGDSTTYGAKAGFRF